MSIFLSLVRSRLFIAALVLGVALIVVAACNGDDDDGDGDRETPAPGEETAEIMMIPSIQFDRSELTISADTDVTITADNTDEGVRHNFSVYTDDLTTDNLGMTEICTAPCVDAVTLNLAAGDYFFRCEVHPAQMTGTLIAQ